MSTTVGFLGTGNMGAPMVRRLLQAGFSVRAWNRTPSKVEPLQNLGAHAAESPADAARGVDLLLLCLADAHAVGAALFGDRGASKSSEPARLLIDFSTIGPRATLEMAQRLRAACGTNWVDAPVSGGVVGAEAGKLVIFCGGEPRDIDLAQPVFAALAQRFARIGALGTGQTLKLCNQLIVSANLVAISESLALARCNGLDITVLPAALAGGFADSLPLQVFGTRMAAGVTRPVLGEIGLMLKDLREVSSIAQGCGCDFPLLTTALRAYEAADERGLAHEDLAALFVNPAPQPQGRTAAL
jgi:3-hydroxyisobutyrate dehydrogenase